MFTEQLRSDSVGPLFVQAYYWRSQRDLNPHIPVRGRTVYPLAYAILLLLLRLELRYTGMALTPADGDRSIWWAERGSNSPRPVSPVLQTGPLPSTEYLPIYGASVGIRTLINCLQGSRTTVVLQKHWYSHSELNADPRFRRPLHSPLCYRSIWCPGRDSNPQNLRP